MSVLLAGFLLGLAGTAHCLAMCGPLAVLSGRTGAGAPTRFVVHHASRVAVYIVLGALAGRAGGALAAFGWQRALALATGALLVAQAIGLGTSVLTTRPGRAIGTLVVRASRRLPRQPVVRAAAFGILNALLPCGLLYAALAAAASLANAAEAAGFMAAFGAAALPAFGVAIWSASAALPRLPPRLARAAPIALALVGVLLIARGWPAAGSPPALHHH